MCAARESEDGPQLPIPDVTVRHQRPVHRTRVTWKVDLGGPAEYDTFVTNLKTALRTVRERVYYVKIDGVYTPPPVPNRELFNDTLHWVQFQLISLISTVDYRPITGDELVAQYSGMKRARYQEARLEYERGGVLALHAWIKAFLKFEKIESNDIQKPWPTKVCRFIGPRSFVYNYALGRYLLPMEKKVFELIDQLYTRFRADNTALPTVLKGLNSADTAKVIVQKYNKFSDPVIISLDAKRWDQHVSVPALQWEHLIYLQFLPESEREELDRLLKMQLNNVVRLKTDDGVISYTLKGVRMSGDMNTSMGNCLLMCSLMFAYIASRGIVHAEVGNNGDDTFVMIERVDLARFREGLHEWWRKMGFTMEYEGDTSNIHAFKFCQSFVHYDGAEHFMVRDPRAVISKDLISIKPLPTRKLRAAYLYSVARGGLALHGGVPILHSFYNMLLRGATSAGYSEYQLKKYHHYFNVDKYNLNFLLKDMNRNTKSITSVSRVVLFDSTGITPEQQRVIEAKYDNTTISVDLFTSTGVSEIRW